MHTLSANMVLVGKHHCVSELEKFADQIVKVSVVAVIKVITNVVSCSLRESDNKCNIF